MKYKIVDETGRTIMEANNTQMLLELVLHSEIPVIIIDTETSEKIYANELYQEKTPVKTSYKLVNRDIFDSQFEDKNGETINVFYGFQPDEIDKNGNFVPSPVHRNFPSYKEMVKRYARKDQ